MSEPVPSVLPTRAQKEAALCRLLDKTPLTQTHWRIWILSAMGIFLDGFDLFIIAVALPLIIRDLNASPVVAGLVGSAAVIGAIFGAGIGGILTDRFGRKAIYIVDLLFFIVFSFACGFCWDITSLIVFRFLLGVGVGADYPICASYVCEFMPARVRGRMLIGAFSFQAIGMFAAAGTGLLILAIHPDETAWRWMLMAGAVPAVIVLLARATVPESPRWHLEKGSLKKAAQIVCGMIPEMETRIRSCVTGEPQKELKKKNMVSEYLTLFQPAYLKRTILASIPWFLMDIATFGVGVFTPTLLAAMIESGPQVSEIGEIYYAIAGSAFLDIFLLAGFLLNLKFVDKIGRIRLQILGFAGMVVGLFMLAASMSLENSVILVFSGFIIFNLLMNAGPNATTFILAAELFPTRIRASGHGFASALAKAGAALGIFFVPVLMNLYGIAITLIAIAVTCIIGLVITAIFRIETSGRALEEIIGEEGSECAVCSVYTEGG